MDYSTFIRNRITALRMKKNISEYQMSLALGQNRNYIQGITSGKALPSMAQFLNICDFFEITPMEFFDTSTDAPQLVQQAFDEIRLLPDSDLLLLLTLIQRLKVPALAV